MPPRLLPERLEYFIVVCLLGVGLFVMGALIEPEIWNISVSVTVAWVFADSIATVLEPESKGQAEWDGHILPLRRTSVAFIIYFLAIIVATIVSEWFLAPSLLLWVASVVQNARLARQLYLVIVSFVASFLVFLNFWWRTIRDRHNDTKHGKQNNKQSQNAPA
jgi:hypothetical protein